MKKKILVALVLAALVLPVFADDALMLPKGVIRTRIVPSYAFANKGFDADGESVDLDETAQFFNLGAAVEYGATDWLTAALQWAPGYNVWSDPGLPAPFDKGTANGAFDLFAGAKVLILGDTGFVPNETMRFAAALGVKIPMPGADFDKEYDNMLAGDPFIAADPDKHAFGMGGRLYFDYIINSDMFVNLYNETIYYFPREDVETLIGTVDEQKYGMDITFEAEFHYAMAVAEALKLNLGLPVRYVMTTESESGADDDKYTFSLNPTVGVFFTGKVPFEVSVAYNIPLMGNNDYAMNTLTFQIKNYLKF